jgi:hypothetical protein
VKIQSTLAVSVAALALGLAMPAMAQQTSDTQAGPTTGATGNNSDTTSNATSLDLNVQDSGNDNSDNSTNDSGNLDVDIDDSGNDNSNNSTNDSGNIDVADSGNDNSDNSTNDSGNVDIADSGNDNSDNSDNSQNALASFNTVASNNTDNSTNDNSEVVANQLLVATISNADELNFDGDENDYSSGNNSVGDNAFAAYAGILNQGWNTGINSNAQAATNIAARGTVTFGN